MGKNTKSSEKHYPAFPLSMMHWPSSVNDVRWALAKSIFPVAIKSLGSRSFLQKPQMKGLLQTMRFQRAFSRVLEDRRTHHKTILLSLLGSASHTSIQRKLGVTHVIHSIRSFLLIWSLFLFQSCFILHPPRWTWNTSNVYFTHTNTPHVSPRSLLSSEIPSFHFTF